MPFCLHVLYSGWGGSRAERVSYLCISGSYGGGGLGGLLSESHSLYFMTNNSVTT